MDFTMPDGTVISNVPDNYRQDQVEALYAKMNQTNPSSNDWAQSSSCPPECSNIVLNMQHRQKAINVAAYGPLNPVLPNRSFWMHKANMFKTTVSEAQTARCGNCAAFNQTSHILDCIQQGLAAGGSGAQDAWDTVRAGDLGFCEIYDFKCASSRSCDSWVAGGPVRDANAGSTPR